MLMKLDILIPHWQEAAYNSKTVWLLSLYITCTGGIHACNLSPSSKFSKKNSSKIAINIHYRIWMLNSLTITDIIILFTFRFGSCEQYEQVSDLCNTYFNETDYVYIKNRMTQSQIATALSRIPTSVSASGECRDNVLKIICHRFFAPCGTNSTIYLPTSICREECSYVRETCQTFWNQAFEAIESELGRVNCETPGSALSPLPTCCTGAGVSILDMTTSELWQPPSS